MGEMTIVTPFEHAPPRFRDASLSTYRPRADSQATALEAVRDWCEAAASGEGPMLALVGVQGTGKSHLLYGAAGLLVARTGRRPYVRAWYQLADHLRYGADGKEAHEVRAMLWGVPIVLLDEVRPTSGTDLDATELAKFACYAYDHRVAVLITTNWHPLANVMGAPAASRFAAVVIDGPDYRQAGAA